LNPTSDERNAAISAVILGAGRSRRMGQPKLILPWGETTVVGQIARTLQAAGIARISVVTGAAREQVESALAGLTVETIYNPEYERSEMLASLKLGLAAQPSETQAILVVLGDQPGIEESVVRRVTMGFFETQARLVAPSYQKRRGHPWLVQRSLWEEILDLPTDQTLRDFLNRHGEEIAYVTVDTASILKDIDTPADYLSERPPTSSPFE
jgi:molybdenum cofactor cytidylyltransferase